MKNTLTIATKEIRTYFASPIAYVITAVYLVITGYFFGISLSGSFPLATINGFLGEGSFILIFIAPLLTMRLLAEEAKMGTLELLLTNPVRDWEVVVGKYLASLAIYLAMLLLTLYYPIVLFWFGDPDLGPILTGYLGIFLMGASTLAVGLLASSLTSSQIVSAVVAFGFLLFLWIIQQVASIVSGPIGSLATYLALPSHFSDFIFGVVDTVNLFYYLSLIVFFVFMTIHALEARRWS